MKSNAMCRITRAPLAAALLLLVGTLPAAAATFNDPPTQPTQPLAFQGVAASIHAAVCFGSADFTAVRTGSLIELRWVEPGCPFEPFYSDVTVALGALPPGNYDLRIVETSDPSHPQIEDETIVTVEPQLCPDATLCLLGGRFQVQATWSLADGRSGQAQPVGLTSETGVLWFFSAENYEVMIKAIDACAYNRHFWIYAGGLTDVRVTLQVTDVVAQVEYVYSNALGSAFAPVRDTTTFACPDVAQEGISQRPR